MDEFFRNQSSLCPDIVQKLNTYKFWLDEFSINKGSCPGNLQIRVKLSAASEF